MQAINGTGVVVELKPEMLISVFPSPGTEKSSAQDGTWTGKSKYEVPHPRFWELVLELRGIRQRMTASPIIADGILMHS